jgi:hypothetical protein
MTGPRRRSDRSGRAPLFSPGRPVVPGRDQQRRFWAAIATGMGSEDAAVQAVAGCRNEIVPKGRRNATSDVSAVRRLTPPRPGVPSVGKRPVA